MGKRTKVKSNVDYRLRWPTQQTLVESWISVESPISKWRHKLHTEWLPRLKKRSPSEPGKSTHPYDTGVVDRRSNSESSSRSSSTLVRDARRCWRLFARAPHVPSSPVHTPKPPRIAEGQPRQELPGTPTQYLRLLTTPIKSPLSRRQATSSPFGSEKAAVKSARVRIPTPTPTPTPTPPAPPPTVNCPIEILSAKYESFARGKLRRRGADPNHTSGS